MNQEKKKWWKLKYERILVMVKLQFFIEFGFEFCIVSLVLFLQ